MHLTSGCSSKAEGCDVPSCLFIGNRQEMITHKKVQAEQHVQLMTHHVNAMTEQISAKV